MKKYKVRIMVFALLGVGVVSTLVDARTANAVDEGQVKPEEIAVVARDQAAVRLQWVKRYNGAAKLNDEPGCSLVTSGGDVYLAGTSEIESSGPQVASSEDAAANPGVQGPLDSPSLQEIVILKYSTTGKRQWVVHETSAGTGCYVNAGALDQQENLFLLAECAGSYVTAKYNPAGHRLWMKRYRGARKHANFPHDIAVDDAGNAYVTGQCWQSASNSLGITTVKYNAGGVMQWVNNYDTIGNNVEDASRIAVDRSGNVYVAGTIYPNGGGSDILTVKLGPDGKRNWAKRYDGPAHGEDSARGIALDRKGNVHVTAYSASSGTGADFLTIKYSPSGKPVWVARLVGAGIAFDTPEAVALDPMGNVFVTGAATVAGTETSFCTVKYSKGGHKQWVKYYIGPVGADWASALAADSKGNAYVTGTSNGASGSLDCVTIKYNAAGKRVWRQSYNGPANDEDRAWWIGLDSAGNAYVSGRSKGATSGYDMFTLKYGR